MTRADALELHHRPWPPTRVEPDVVRPQPAVSRGVELSCRACCLHPATGLVVPVRAGTVDLLSPSSGIDGLDGAAPARPLGLAEKPVARKRASQEWCAHGGILPYGAPTLSRYRALGGTTSGPCRSGLVGWGLSTSAFSRQHLPGPAGAVAWARESKCLRPAVVRGRSLGGAVGRDAIAYAGSRWRGPFVIGASGSLVARPPSSGGPSRTSGG